MSLVALAVIVFVVVLVVAVAVAAIWSGQLPLLRVLTGAKTVGPVGRPPYTATSETDFSFLAGDFPLPGALDPDTAADVADRTYRTAQQARRDYEATKAAGYIQDDIDAWAATLPDQRKEQP